MELRRESAHFLAIIRVERLLADNGGLRGGSSGRIGGIQQLPSIWNVILGSALFVLVLPPHLVQRFYFSALVGGLEDPSIILREQQFP